MLNFLSLVLIQIKIPGLYLHDAATDGRGRLCKIMAFRFHPFFVRIAFTCPARKTDEVVKESDEWLAFAVMAATAFLAQAFESRYQRR